MNEQEKEINLKRLCYKALRSWRKVALVAVVGALVVGGTKCGIELSKISDPEVLEARQIQYQGELALHQQKGDLILKEIDTLETTLEQQKDYNENSVLMEIDPYNEWNGSVDFYVETDWQILPELAVQEQNPANQIVRVYGAYITNGELYQYVMDGLGKEMDARYLREMIVETVDPENYMIHFTVKGVSEASCKELLTLIEAGMRAKQEEIVKSVGEYELLTTNSSAYAQINYELEQMQKDNLQKIADTETALSAKQFELMEWRREGKNIEAPVVKKNDAVKEGLKMAILTGVVLGVLMVFYYGITYLLSKYIQDKDEFDGWGVYVTELPRAYQYRAFRWVDRIIGAWFLGNVGAGEYDTRLAAATKQMGEAAKLTFETTEPRLTLVGDLPKEELTALAEAMQKEKNVRGVTFTVAGNPALEAGAIDNILFADGVVLVAKQEYTKRETLYQMKAQVQELKKPLVAVVLTNTDAMV